MIENTNKDDKIIETLVKSFFKGSLPNLHCELNEAMTWDTQEKFLNQTIHSTLFKKYPGNPNFSKLFFKKLIEFLEPEQEVHDDIYEYLCSIMENTEDRFSYRHYLIDNSLNNIVTIKETKNMVLNGTTGLRTWEAAFMLSDWALCNKEIFSNKSILELGSGAGFTGITISKHCDVKSMVMSDFHEEVLKTINDNVRINILVSEVQQNNNSTIYRNDEKEIGVMKLDWNDTENLPQNLMPDIIIGADIVYDPSIFQPLIAVFEYFYNINKDVEIYIASIIRNADTLEGFLNNLEISNFKHTEIPLSQNTHIQWDENLLRCFLRINKE